MGKVGGPGWRSIAKDRDVGTVEGHTREHAGRARDQARAAVPHFSDSKEDKRHDHAQDDLGQEQHAEPAG